MLEFTKYTLDNGLKLIVNEDTNTPLVAINILYCVGSRNEDPERTGFAHLFEHLMFGGSKNIPSFDEPLQMVGGENNAFTNADITNYYITLPVENIETALWLESDRMLELNFSEQNLAVQQNVVIEEFRQRYLNQPYGDVWLHLNPLAFKVHPYQWPTIGKNIDHIQNATLNEVKSFFYSHYAPNNAILTISGNIKPDTAFTIVNKWFGKIPSREVIKNHVPTEPLQNEIRKSTLYRNVPYDSIYKVWHIAGRKEKEFHICDLITDLLAGGRSGRLYHVLVKEKRLFSDINAFVTGSVDPGLLVISGKLMEGIQMDKAEQEINNLLDELIEKPLDNKELQKVKNKFEAHFLLGQTNILSKAMGLSYFEMLGNVTDINRELENYQSITQKDICLTASKVFDPANCSTLYYLAEKNK